MVGRLLNLVLVSLLVVATSWFAGPAFSELAHSGYGAAPGPVAMPEVNPLFRVILNKVDSGVSLSAAPGQARLEFNIALRQFSAMVALVSAFAIVAFAAGSMEMERRRDTWFGLIATPLTGWEILRAKMLGALWYARWYLVILITLWTLGLVAGALHPIGYLAGLAELIVMSGFFAAWGISKSLWKHDQEPGRSPIVWPVQVLVLIGESLLLMVGPIVFTTVSLLSYEDIADAIHSDAFLPLRGWSRWAGVNASAVVLAWLIAIIAVAFATFNLARTMSRGFDAVVGRPTLHRQDMSLRARWLWYKKSLGPRALLSSFLARSDTI
jgi:hypothetical protein